MVTIRFISFPKFFFRTSITFMSIECTRIMIQNFTGVDKGWNTLTKIVTVLDVTTFVR